MSKPKAKARVFVPLYKVDEENRLVHGRITQEILDKSGEVMDYVTSKPLFEKWSNGISEASGGLSKGNVRVMHGLTAAGKLTELEFDDTEKAIDVCAKIVDDQEWEKVVEGVYTGFSVGGSYAKRWTETGDAGAKIKKYTADPNEVSLVDNACVPTATFQFAKADGSVVAVPFQVEHDEDKWPGFTKADDAEGDDEDDKDDEEDGDDADDKKKSKKDEVKKSEITTFNPSNAEVAVKAEELCKAAGDASRDWMDFIPDAREALIKAHAELNPEEAPATEEVPAEPTPVVEKTTAPGIKQGWTASDGEFFEKKADAEAHEEGLAKNAGQETDAQRLAKMLQRVKDGVTEVEEAVPEGGDTVFTDLDRLHKAFLELEQPRDNNGGPALEKGMYTVSRFAEMIGSAASLARTIKSEGVLEGGDEVDENVSESITSSLKGFGDNFLTYAKQQVAELLKGLDVDVSPKCCYDYYYRAAQDDTENALAKDVCDLIESVKDDLGDDYDPSPEDLAKRAPVDEVVPLAKFQKLEGEYTEMKKVTEDAIEQLSGLAKRVAIIEETPMPRSPQHVVDKNHDTLSPLGKLKTEEEGLLLLKGMIEKHGPDNLALMMIKAAQANPQTMGGGR